MCGRYTLITDLSVIEASFHVQEVTAEYRLSNNISPGQQIPAVIHDNKIRLVIFRWGLIPSWAKDPKIGHQCINAKAETVAEKPSFRSAFKKRRCLVVATGFYEWQVRGAHKQPMWIGLKNQRPFAFAGLWEHWTSAEGQPLETCTIITTEPNDLMAPIHNRMPVILSPTSYDQWLDPTFQQIALLNALLRPYPSKELTAYPVSTLVNNPRHDAPQCLEPVSV
jgi:putative SOS response-associated peptidase YedK